MKLLLITVLVSLPGLSSHAATTYNGTWSVSTAIPDYNDPGFSSTKTLAVSGTATITSVMVGLVFSGGWNGDLYAYLVHDGQISILLNRVGRTSGNPNGFASSGMTVSLADAAPLDIHTALGNSGTPNGTFQPDGRATDPLNVLDTDARTNPLSAFNGRDASGNWTLFIADQASGEVSTIENWSLNVTTIPEPSLLSLALFPLGVLLLKRKR